MYYSPTFLAAAPARARTLASSAAFLLALGVLAAGCDLEEPTPDDPSNPFHAVVTIAQASRSLATAQATVWNRAPDPHSVDGTIAPTALALPASGMSLTPTADANTLILYDTGGEYGWLGELYAVSVANLVSHFGRWTAIAARTYACGQMAPYTATIYIGSSYDEPLPACLLDDVVASPRPVMWIDFNFWRLVAHVGASEFASRYGFTATRIDATSSWSGVTYRGRTLTRYAGNPGILAIEIGDRSRATELATAVRADGTTAPWAVRSGQLTLVSEVPFSFVSEEDRVLAFEDMLFDLFDPARLERHRAMLRLEDVSPASNPADLRAIADYLSSVGVPFGFGVIAQYRDPLGYYHMDIPLTIEFGDEPALVDALRYMESHGGTMVMHGWTHQWDGGPNPYDQVSGDDTEFYRIEENADESFDYVGPLPDDSIAWASARIRSAEDDYRSADLTVPTIFEFPHYAASANSYAAVAMLMSARWERASYYAGVLGGGSIDHAHAVGQMFPFAVRDVYGSMVLPENLGNIEPLAWHGLPSRSAADIVRAADRNLVIRDGVACFFFHPFYPIAYLREAVEGIQALGYTFVSPTSL